MRANSTPMTVSYTHLIAYCLRVLTDYLDLLHDWRERYKPASPEEPHDPRFEEALHMTEAIEHLTDCVAFGTPQQKAAAAAQLLSGSYLLMLEERTDRLALDVYKRQVARRRKNVTKTV